MLLVNVCLYWIHRTHNQLNLVLFFSIHLVNVLTKVLIHRIHQHRVNLISILVHSIFHLFIFDILRLVFYLLSYNIIHVPSFKHFFHQQIFCVNFGQSFGLLCWILYRTWNSRVCLVNHFVFYRLKNVHSHFSFHHLDVNIFLSTLKIIHLNLSLNFLSKLYLNRFIYLRIFIYVRLYLRDFWFHHEDFIISYLLFWFLHLR